MEASVEALPPAGRAAWTPEEAGRYKEGGVLYQGYHTSDSLLRQCSSDRKLMVLAQRIGLFPHSKLPFLGKIDLLPQHLEVN